MIRMSHRSLILLSGCLWLAMGGWLLQMGVKFLVETSKTGGPLLDLLKPMAGSLENGATLLLALALLIGYFKGKKVLGKSAMRGVKRLLTLPNPALLSQIYPASYYLLIGSMVLLGLSIKWLGLSLDVRGFVDTAIGAALINGSTVYFRQALLVVGGASGDLKGTEDLLEKD